MRALVIGGGAAGLMAGCRLAEHGASVIVLERAERVGRKLPATGNGRCNLCNRGAVPERYHGDPALLASVLARWTPERVEQVFSGMGIPFLYDGEGRAYPASMQAASVLSVLRMTLSERGGSERTGFEAVRIAREGSGFLVAERGGETLFCDKVLVTCGGAAAPKLGGSSGGYRLLTGLGHSLVRPEPVLVPLKTETGPIRGWKGVRIRGRVRLTAGGRTAAEESGEMLFTEYGLSGICVMQLSRYLPGLSGAELHADLMPSLTREELFRRAYRLGARPAAELLTGCLPRQAGKGILASVLGETDRLCGELTHGELGRIDCRIHDLTLRVTGTTGMENAQVTRGGIPGTEFCPDTLESRLVPGAYAAGEVLDVDGDCGGFNLHWAWASALTAADAAAGRSDDGTREGSVCS